MSVLSRLLLRRLLASFGTALAFLTALMLVNQIAKQLPRLLQAGVSTGTIVKVFVLSLPFIMAMTVPIAVLIAVLRVCSRLARDEPFHASDVGPLRARRVFPPVLTFAAGIAVCAYLLNNQILPVSNHQLRLLLVEIQRGQPASGSDTYRGDREMSIGELRRVVSDAQAEADSALAQGQKIVAAAARERAAIYEVEIQKKLAIAAACFVLALFGAPLALRFQGRGVGLVTGVTLAASAFYYVGLIAGEDIGDRRLVSPFLAMWVPNLLFVVVGLAAVWRVPTVAPIHPQAPVAATGHYLTRLWQGRIPLDVTYWIWGVLIGLVLGGVTRAARGLWFGRPFAFVYFAYTAFVLVAIWRSAARYPGRRFWAILARIAVVFTIVYFVVALIVLRQYRAPPAERDAAACAPDCKVLRLTPILAFANRYQLDDELLLSGQDFL